MRNMEPEAPVSNSNLETTTTSSPKGNAKEDSPPVPGLDVLANAVDGELHNVTTKPGPNDVLLGRGGGPNNHDGNIKFRNLVHAYKMRYMLAVKTDKPKVAREVVRIWRQMKPRGRFLARLDNSKKGPGSFKNAKNVWFDVGDKKAREKASQCLRELTPDVLPIIKHLSIKNIPNYNNFPSPPTEREIPPPAPFNLPPVVPPPSSTSTTAPVGAAPVAMPKMLVVPQPCAVTTTQRINALPMVPVLPMNPIPPYFAAAPTVCVSPLTATTLPYPAALSYDTNSDKIQSTLDVSQMSELEYQQHMLLMQHSLVQQQFQVQRLQQAVLQAQEQRKRHEISKVIAAATRKQLS